MPVKAPVIVVPATVVAVSVPTLLILNVEALSAAPRAGLVSWKIKSVGSIATLISVALTTVVIFCPPLIPNCLLAPEIFNAVLSDAIESVLGLDM